MPNHEKQLRRGWTTGACAAAAAKSAYHALINGDFLDPVEITLPRGQKVSFVLAFEDNAPPIVTAGIIKDAGDDPDVTHGAMIKATVTFTKEKTGTVFKAGEGVGRITKPGLPLRVGQAAINPVPREMIASSINEIASSFNSDRNVQVEISVPGGEALALKTWNPQLGIVGGISILGTTGVVIPFSCSAWIHSIHRGIDVARATKTIHVGASTGSTSGKAVRAKYNLPETSMIDMGDFAGGMLKYLRGHPIPRITIGGGVGKLSKLAQGHLDLHSGRSQLDLEWLAEQALTLGASNRTTQVIRKANSALEVFEISEKQNLPLANLIASKARAVALNVLSGAPTEIEILVFSRQGKLLGVAHGW